MSNIKRMLMVFATLDYTTALSGSLLAEVLYRPGFEMPILFIAILLWSGIRIAMLLIGCDMYSHNQDSPIDETDFILVLEHFGASGSFGGLALGGAAGVCWASGLTVLAVACMAILTANTVRNLHLADCLTLPDLAARCVNDATHNAH